MGKVFIGLIVASAMKKGMMIVGMISLILVVVLVSGVKTEKEYPGTTINAEFILQDYEFKKGWNLVQGILNPEWIESNSENIKAIYAFNPKSKEYVRFFPEAERDKIGGTNYAWHSFATIGALWVYSDKEFNSKYWK